MLPAREAFCTATISKRPLLTRAETRKVVTQLYRGNIFDIGNDYYEGVHQKGRDAAIYRKLFLA